MDYEERETLKRQACDVLESPAAPDKKAHALLSLIESHYWRAREALNVLPKPVQRKIHGARYCPGYQLDIDVYTRHWLSANGARLIAAEVLAQLYSDFPGYQPEKNKFLPVGKSIYSLTYAN